MFKFPVIAEYDGTSPDDEDSILPPDDEDTCLENEEEYDALNDETFGGLEDASSIDDWEQQHEQFAAEIAESSRYSEQIENSISHLVLDEETEVNSKKDNIDKPLSTSSLSDSVWSYTPTSQNGDVFNTSILSSLQKASKSFIATYTSSPKSLLNPINTPELLPAIPAQPKNICTVEELEKNLLKSAKPPGPKTTTQPPPQSVAQTPHLQPHVQVHHPQQQRPLVPLPGVHLPGPNFHTLLQHPVQNARLPPPGLHPSLMAPPGLRHLSSPLNHHHLPPGMLPPAYMRMMPPHPQFLQANGHIRPPGFMYPPPGSQNQFLRPYNYHPGPIRHPHNMQPAPAQHHHQQQRNNNQPPYLNIQLNHHRPRQDNGGNYNRHQQQKEREGKDEYAGLMTPREKQWLLNIQMLQLNTGTPYFDDYYYTVFKERKAKINTEKNNNNEKTPHHQNRRQHRNSDRQENQNTLTPRIYTPLQFENSLGKLQCGSVTAPRKIIDMDIFTPEKDSDSPQVSRDTRKTKQLLLELEALYALLLKAEDIDNPLYVTNMDKLREIKQKQRLRELELAPTPEQKQEILKLFKLESEPIVEHQYEYINKVLQGLLVEEKFSSFLNIRKGKMLVLRLLPHLMGDEFSTHLLELWSKILLSLSITGRRDTAGENIFPRFYSYFKRFVESSTMSDILEVVSSLVEVFRQDTSNRSTPLSHVGKSPLYFVLLNKFGTSALSTLLVKVEEIISSEEATEKQQNDWSNFLISWAQQTDAVSKVAVPIDLIPIQTFSNHCSRFTNLKSDRKSLLEKYFVEGIN